MEAHTGGTGDAGGKLNAVDGVAQARTDANAQIGIDFIDGVDAQGDAVVQGGFGEGGLAVEKVRGKIEVGIHAHIPAAALIGGV